VLRLTTRAAPWTATLVVPLTWCFAIDSALRAEKGGYLACPPAGARMVVSLRTERVPAKRTPPRTPRLTSGPAAGPSAEARGARKLRHSPPSKKREQLGQSVARGDFHVGGPSWTPAARECDMMDVRGKHSPAIF
jgi:hypothetical protein